MDRKYNWLNGQVERLHANSSTLAPLPGVEYAPSAEDVSALRMAALLNAARSADGACRPTSAFLSILKERVRAEASAHSRPGGPTQS